MDSNKPNKGLGCLQAVNDNMTEELEYKMNQCRIFADRIHGPRVSLREAHTLVDDRVILSVPYSMPLTSFTQQECKNLNTVINRTVLNTYRFNQHIPRTSLYSPLELREAKYLCFEGI